MKYYIVTTKCGHVGKNNYILIDFPVIAEDGKEAAKIAREIPRVKHHHKDAIRKVEEVSYERFLLLCKFNNHDDYLKSNSKQEQLLYCEDIKDRIIEEEKPVNEISVETKWFHKKKIRNYKKFLLSYGGNLWKQENYMNSLMN